MTKAAIALAVFGLLTGCGTSAYFIASSPGPDEPASVLKAPGVPFHDVRIDGQPIHHATRRGRSDHPDPSDGKPIQFWHADYGEPDVRIPPGEHIVSGVFRYTCDVRVRTSLKRGYLDETFYDFTPEEIAIEAAFTTRAGVTYRLELTEGGRVMVRARDYPRREPAPPTFLNRFVPLNYLDGYLDMTGECPELIVLRITEVAEEAEQLNPPRTNPSRR